MPDLDHLEITRTYAGCYEGVPDPQRMIAAARDGARKSSAPVHLIDPEIKDNGHHKSLPKYHYIAEFVSFAPLYDKEATGSHLVVVWWSDSYQDDPLAVAGKLDWKKLAKDWYF